MEINELSAFELSQKVAKREVSSLEVVETYLKRIEAVEPSIDAYLRVEADCAREQAKAIDGKLDAGLETGPLAGVPIAVKDNILTRGIETTAASRIIEGFLPPYDATAIAKLKAADAVILGKTNLDEFGMGSSCEYSAFKPTRNPWNVEFVPGGSSGGSAAAVAIGCAPAALGSDTGGSVRQPASLCGIAGLKPTYGLVSRYGLIAFASSLDQIGPLARDTRDLALVMSVISGHDEKDATTMETPAPDFFSRLEEGISGMKLGIPVEYVSQITDPEVKSSFEAAVGKLAGLGTEMEEVSLPHAEYSIAAYYIIAPAEASSNLARFTGMTYSNRQAGGKYAREVIDRTRALFGPEVKRRIMLGSFVLSTGYYDAYYLRASKTRNLICRDFDNALERCDALISPTTPTPAFRFGEKLADPLQMYLFDVMTVGVNLAGLPALSIPCGKNAAGLPVGLQIIGPRLSDAKLLQIGRAFELETGLSNMIAPTTGGQDK